MDYLTPDPKLYNVPWMTDEFNGMPWRLFGRSGLRISAVGLGTWKMGYPDTGDGARVDEPTSFAILDRAIELGMTHWDTANRYNNASGNCERILGKWFKANPDQRRNVVIATKIFGGMDGRSPNHSRLSRLSVMESTYACLERMQVESIDIMYFHSYDPITPIEESLEAMEDLIRQDLVRYLAVSNYTVDQLRATEAAALSVSSRVRIHAVENNYDIVNREKAGMGGVLDWCARTGVSYIAWSPLARGLLTNRYL
ncbi:aldo/keto reductase, partial [bacterium]|nr:aldo/keto reductase [bacterium]